MRLFFLYILLLIGVAYASINDVPVKYKNKGTVAEIEMSTESGHDMYQRWTDQAFSSLLAAVATRNMHHLSDLEQVHLEECSKAADTVIKHARCVKKVLDQRDKRKQSRVAALRKKKLEKDTVTERKKEGEWVGGIRIRRSVAKAERYGLKTKNDGMTAFGAVAKVLNQAVSGQKNKTEPESWQMAVEKVRLSAHKRKAARKAFAERQEKGDFENLQQLAFRNLGQKHSMANELEGMIEKPDEMKKMIRDKKFKMMADPVGRMTNLVREGVKLGFSLAGQNSSDLDEKTLSLISPRFFSVTPEQDADGNSTVNILSPSLLSLHNEGSGTENLTSLPTLVKGFNGRDQQEWLNFIVEAAGVSDQAEKLDQETEDISKVKSIEDYEKEVRGKDGQPLYFTKKNVTDMYGDYEKRKVETFEELSKSYTKQQLKEMNTTGFSILNKDQLRHLYGPDSPYNHTESYHKLTNMSKSHILSRMEKDIELITQMEKFENKQKDIALSPIVLSPLILATPALNTFVVLSPLVLSPIILSPAVLGPIILSPWVFIPLILSPRVLSPLILTPMIFSPLILSPLVLHPLILCPGVFNPLILTPLVLSPLILSPQVFTPIILSPLVLNPLILNPMVGSPLVLSPFVLSPLILSPQALFALVLSPYAASPLIESKLIVASLVLSPSWLS
ncbi:unnamed protein product [Bursaphelenchus xylophilus]|uniref:(pine wood nematode) hypothetical protein n=1 Tax=Bursaphelenchus xylophilus TaxID=6326 RepID=A0A1I7RPP0_BURXY|nr:unnamed protein product [Bursaphelenchus xylophilus]CAG9096370.1 unnamed protein product [Bursaphelenchus xylophilus]